MQRGVVKSLPENADLIAEPPVSPVVDSADRLAALSGLSILDSPAEQSFDDIVRLATRLCTAPVALVSLVTADRQWFKARVGFPLCETDLDRSVCKFALTEPDLLIIPDLTADPRTSSNPLVTGDPSIRFYAGAPLRLSSGEVVGSLCVIDTVPRPEGLTPEQADDLRALGRQVSDRLEMRRALGARDALLTEQAGARREREVLVRTQATVAAAPGGELDPILNTVTAGALLAVPTAEGAVIELIDGDDLEYCAVAGTLAGHRGLRVPLHDSLAGKCALADTPMLANDVLRDGQVKPHLAEMLAMRSAVLAPISRGGRVVGVLKLQASRNGAFQERDLDQTQLFAGAATAGLTAVAEAEAGRAQRRSQRRLDLLARISEALLTATDPARAVEPILAAGAASLGFEHSYLYDITHDGRHLALTHSVGASEEARNALRHVDFDTPLCGIVAQTRRPLVLAYVLSTEEPRYALAREAGIDAFAGYPITSRGSVVGVISFCATTEPVFDADALGFFETVARYLSAVRERLDGEAALRESDARSRRAQEAGQVGAFEIAIDAGLMTVSSEMARIYGLPPSGIYSTERFEALILPEYRNISSTEVTRRDGSATRDAEYRIRRANDGEVRWISRRAGFDIDPGGKARRMYGTVQDITERKAAEARLAVSEERWRGLFENMQEGFFVGEIVRDADGAARDFRFLEVNPAFPRQTGLPDDTAGRTMRELVPEIPPWLAESYDRVVSTGEPEMFEIEVPQLGRVFEARARPEKDGRFAVMFLDVTARKRADADQRLVNEEISHRLKNTLAMVLSIAGQTLRGVSDRAPIKVFEQRIHALSSAHDVLLRQSWASAPAKDVVKAVMAGAGHAERIEVTGPEIDLGPRATLSLSLVLHELTTNAAKYGALSVPSGRVSVDWSLGGEGEEREVTLEWSEVGGPPVTPPPSGGRKGFGSRLIGMGLVGTGGVDLSYPASGFQVTMRAPLVELQRS